MMKRNFDRLFKLNKILLLSSTLLISSHVLAGTSTTTIPVSATVVSSCTISATPLAFGQYTLAVSTTTSTVTALCTAGSTFQISIDAGANAGGTTNYTARAMKSGTNTLSYQIYTDAAFTNPITTIPSGGGNFVSNQTGTAANQNYIVYGRIPAGLTSPVSGTAYTDTLNVIITFT